MTEYYVIGSHVAGIAPAKLYGPFGTWQQADHWRRTDGLPASYRWDIVEPHALLFMKDNDQ